MNHKRIYRLYRAEQLSVRRRKRKRFPSLGRVLLAAASRLNQRWVMDFMSDQLACGPAQ